MKINTALFAAMLLNLTACASIVSNSTNPVTISSIPDQANFTVTDKKGVKVHTGTTPQTVTLEAGSGYFSSGQYTIDYSKDGYQPQSTQINAGLNGWYWGNLGFGGLLGFLVIDPATGAMWKLPERAEAALTPGQ